MATPSPSHLFSPKRTLSVARVSLRSPSLSRSRTSSLCLPSFSNSNSNSRPRLHPRLACAAITKLSEAEPIPIPQAQDPQQQLDHRIPLGAGVYGVYDSNGELQFVGTSRSVACSIRKHMRLLPALCSSVKVASMGKGKIELSALRDAFNAWIGEHISLTGNIPPGNATKSDIWAAPPMNLRLVPEQLESAESQIQLINQLLKEHHMVVFIHGTPRKVKRKHDLEHYASTRVLGLLLSHGLYFVTVDLVDECHTGLQECLHENFGSETCPQVFVEGKLIGGEEEIRNLADFGELHTLSCGFS